jgi:hypothetical protein
MGVIIWYLHAGMSLKKPKVVCPDSKRLADWLEQGVFNALDRKHLRTLMFGIVLRCEIYH